jgi:hypothetical protein
VVSPPVGTFPPLRQMVELFGVILLHGEAKLRRPVDY